MRELGSQCLNYKIMRLYVLIAYFDKAMFTVLLFSLTAALILHILFSEYRHLQGRDESVDFV